jgi:hypothetical protein
MGGTSWLPAAALIPANRPATQANWGVSILLAIGRGEPYVSGPGPHRVRTLFLVEGVLLLLAGRQFVRTPKARRRWTISVIAATALVDVFGLVLALRHQHVAVF